MASVVRRAVENLRESQARRAERDADRELDRLSEAQFLADESRAAVADLESQLAHAREILAEREREVADLESAVAHRLTGRPAT
jgi:hypothetical protein